MLSVEGCAARQRRFRERLEVQNIDAAVLADPRDVYYLTGVLSPNYPIFLYLETSGGSWLVSPSDEGAAAVDDRLTYETNKLYTTNPDLMGCLARVAERRIQGQRTAPRIGWQSEALPRLLGQVVQSAVHPEEWVPIDPILIELQQVKDPDEIELLKKSIACTLAGYRAAEKAIRPGVNELEVLAEAHRAAMLEAGEIVRFGGDFRSGEFGGPARDRKIEAGELYIIDAGSTYQGYASDMARAYAVTEPTDLQVSVYNHVAQVLREVPSQLKPGGSGTELWQWMDAQLREHPYLADKGLITHAGHGIGTRAHEMPDLNRDRGGTFQVGNVVTCEPGGYGPELRYGVRLENTFLITENGAENISEYPLDPRAALK